MSLTVGLHLKGDASSAKAAISETKAGLDNFRKSADGAAGAAKKANTTIAASATSSKALAKEQRIAASHTANLGYQFNDIAIMLAAGQNPFQLAMQQGTQVAQVMQQMGGGTQALRGLAAGFAGMINPMSIATLGIIAFGAMGVQALMSLRTETKTLEDHMDDLSDSVSRYTKFTQIAGRSSDDLAKEFGETGGAAGALARHLSDFAKLEAMEKVNASVKELTESYGGLSRTQNVVLDNTRGFWASFFDKDPVALVKEIDNTFYTLRAELDLTDKQAAAVVLGLEKISNASSIADQARASSDFSAAMKAAFGSIDKIPPALREIAKQAGIIALEGAKITDTSAAWKRHVAVMAQNGRKLKDEIQERFRLNAHELDVLKQRRALNELILLDGRGSIRVKDLEHAQAIENFEFEIDARVRQNELTAVQGELQKEAFRNLKDSDLSLWNMNQALRANEEAARQFAQALQSVQEFSLSIEDRLIQVRAKLDASAKNQNQQLAGTIALERERALRQRDAVIEAAKGDQRAIDAAEEQYQTNLANLDLEEQLSAELDSQNEERRKANKLSSGYNRTLKQTRQEIERMNRAANPFEAYAEDRKKLDDYLKQGLTTQAYNREIQRLNDGLADQLPLVNDLSEAWADWAMNGFKDFQSFKDSVINSFKSMLRDMIAMAARNQILISLGLQGSSGGAALGGAGQLLGSIGSSFLSGPIGSALGSTAIGAGLGSLGYGFMAGSQSLLTTGLGGWANTVQMSALNAGAMSTIGAALPVIGAVAAAVSLFSKKTKELDSGLRLTAKGAAITAQSFSKIRVTRFWGLSKRDFERYRNINSGPFQQMYDQVYGSVSGLASQLGVGANAFEGFTHSMKLSLRGLNKTQRTEKVTKAMTDLSNRLARTAVAGVDTAQELEGLVTKFNLANATFDQLGLKVYETSVSGARAAERMLGYFKDLEDFTQSANFYYDNFYSDAEKQAFNVKNLSETLNELGFRTIPQTRAQFRMLVEGVRDAGLDAQTAALLQIAPLFDQVEKAWTQSAEEIQGNLDDAQRAVDTAYREAVKTIEAEKQTILDHWSGMLKEMEQKITEASQKLSRKQLAFDTIFDRLGDGLSKLVSDVSDQVSGSRDVIVQLKEVLNSGSGIDNTLFERQRALNTIRSGDRDGLSDALSILSRGDAALYTSREEYLRAQVLERTALRSLLSDTEVQLTVEEQSLAALEAQQSSLTSVKELMEEQIAIAKGQAVSLTDAVGAIFGTGSVTSQKILDLISTTDRGTSVAHADLLNLLSGLDVNSSILGYAQADIQALADLNEQKQIVQAAADKQIENAEVVAATQLDALNQSVSGILQLDTTMLSVADAVRQLEQQLQIQTAQLTLQQMVERERAVESEYFNARQNIETLALKYNMPAWVGYGQNDPWSFKLPNGSSWFPNITAASPALLAAASVDQRAIVDALYGANGLMDVYLPAKRALSEQRRAVGQQRNFITSLGGVPAFARGGFHDGGMRLVGEKGPELEVTGPSRIYSSQQTRQILDNSDLIAEVQALRKLAEKSDVIGTPPIRETI